MTEPSTTTTSCCAPEAQATCCEPCEKDTCCQASAAGDSCGCSAGQASQPAGEPAVRETVRDRYAAAARAMAERQTQLVATEPAPSCCATDVSTTDAS